MPKSPANRAILDRLFSREIHRHQLENGLTLLHVPDHSAKLISAQIWVKTGSIHEGDHSGSGLSHFLEHLLFKGTAKRKGPKISEEVQAHGGHINAYTTFDRTVYHIDGPSESTSIFLDILSDISFSSTLPPEEITKERSVILREIDMGLDDPDNQLSRATFDTAFQVHPYRHPVIGHRQLFESIQEEALRNYYQSRYVPNNSLVVLVGDIDPVTARKLFELHFGKVPMGSLAPVYIPSEPQQLSYRERKLKGDYNIVRGALAFPIPSLWSKEAPELTILASILGGGESSILWHQLREVKNLVHYIDVHCWNPGSSGLLWVSYYCQPEHWNSIEQRILDCLQQTAAEGINRKHLDKAIRQAIVSEVNSRNTLSGQASRIGISEVVVGESDHARTFFKRLENVTPETTSGLIQKYLLTNNHSHVSLGPKPAGKSSGTTVLTSSKSRSTLDFKRFDLANGTTLLFQEDRKLPKLHAKAILRSGPLYEPENQRGVSELLSTVLAKDTEKRSAATLADTIESVGGSFGGSGGNNTLCLSVDTLAADMELAVDILTEALLKPAFAEESFATERHSQIADIQESEDDIGTYGGRRLRKHFFGSHPFHTGAQGIIEHLRNLTTQDLRAYWARILRPGNLVLSVSGDVKEEALIPLVEALAEQIPQGEDFKPSEFPFVKPVTAVGTILEPMDREQALLFQAYPDLGFAHPSRYTSTVLTDLLSGMSSNLFHQVRELRSMAYYVGANRCLGPDFGMFYLYAGTSPKQVNEVWEQFDEELKRLQSGQIDDEEIQRSKTRLKVAKRSQSQTASNRTLEAGINHLFKLPNQAQEIYDQQIDQVSARDIYHLLNDHILKQPPLKVLVRPNPKKS
jgi:zinc protease